MQERDVRLSRRGALAGGLALAAGGGVLGTTANAQAAADVTYVIFQASINTQTTVQLMAKINQIQSREIYLAMSTPGGEVVAGITAYNLLRALPKKLTTHNIGNVDLIGSMIFLAGEQRMANAHSTFLLHGITRQVSQNTALTTNLLNEFLDGNRADEKRIAAIINERTNLSLEQIARFFREGKTDDAPAALADGIIQQIAELRIPAGAPTVVVQ